MQAKRKGHAVTISPEQLRAYMDEHGLDEDQVADDTRQSIWTVKSWLKPATSKSHRDMQDSSMELLQMKVAERAKAKADDGHKGGGKTPGKPRK